MGLWDQTNTRESRAARISAALNRENRHRISAREAAEYAEEMGALPSMPGGRTRANKPLTREEKKQIAAAKEREKGLKKR